MLDGEFKNIFEKSFIRSKLTSWVLLIVDTCCCLLISLSVVPVLIGLLIKLSLGKLSIDGISSIARAGILWGWRTARRVSTD